MLEDLSEELAGFPLRHRQVVKEVVATVARCSSGNLTLIVGNELEGATHEVSDVLRLKVATKQEIVASEASHRAPINDAVFPLRIVPEEGRSKMLDGVERTRMNDGLAVRLFHTDVESRDGLTANLILTGDIDTTQQFLVVNGK